MRDSLGHFVKGHTENHGKATRGRGFKHSEEHKAKIRAARALQLPPVPPGFQYPNVKCSRVHIERMTLRYRTWREEVFKRDDYTCQDCGVRGGRLNADHIQSFARFPSLRYELSNGRTLCEPCHRLTPTFGGKSKRGYTMAI